MLSFSEYDFEKELGKGQFTVYEARNLSDNRKYAVKVIEIPADDKIEENKIISEALIHSRLSHLNSIVPFIGLCREEYTTNLPTKRMLKLGLVMEKMQNSLDNVIIDQCNKKIYFKIEELRKFVRQTYEGFVDLQKLKIAHRDIKPSNILIDENGDYKIADVGTGKAITAYMNSNTVAGTPHYLSPEIMKAYIQNDEHCKYDPFCSDVFSYGLTLLKMATFDKIAGFNLKENANNKKKSINSLDGIYSENTKELKNLIRNLLKFKPEKRKDFLANQELAEKFYNFHKNERKERKSETIEKHDYSIIQNERKSSLSSFDGTKITFPAKSIIISSIEAILNKEINPHLEEKHKKIYNEYVNDWIWLNYDTNDWNWWWWSYNYWWNNQECKYCTELNNKYEDQLNALDEKRKKMILNKK